MTWFIVLVVAVLATGAFFGLRWLWHANDCTPNEIAINGQRADCDQPSSSPSALNSPVSNKPSSATPAALPYALPAGIRARCGWTQVTTNGAPLSPCTAIKGHTDERHNIRVRFTFEGLNLAAWNRLSADTNGGSWMAQLQMNGTSYSTSQLSGWNGNDLYRDVGTGKLVGGDPTAVLYLETIVNQTTDVPEIIQVMLTSADHPELNRSFPVTLR